ncbi:MAG TPA: hypothetical protein VMR70_06905 [Flavisolibacter sp.]|nr:hypothetical protein [Flavisolibacter sp.]
MLFAFFTKLLQPVAFLLYLIGFFIYRRRQQQSNDTQALFVYFILATILHFVIGICIIVNNKIDNIWLYEISALLTATFIGYYFCRILPGKYQKRTVIICVTVYLLYACFRQFTLEGQRVFDSIGYALLSASVAAYVFMYFQQLLKNVTEVSILQDFNFWLSSSFLLYFVGSFIIFVNYHNLTNKYLKRKTPEDMELLMALWGLHNVLLFLGALVLLTGSLWVSYRRKLT